MAQQDDVVRFRVNDKTFAMLDPDDLELGEAEQIEAAFDLPLEEIDFRRTKALRLLFMFSLRRAGEDVSADELAAMKVTDVFPPDEVEESNGAKPRPTRAKKAKPA